VQAANTTHDRPFPQALRA